MKFSKFSHFFDVSENIVGIYHSLLVKTAFLSKEEIDNVRLYFKNGTFTNDELKDVAKYLYENYFIIKTQEEDDSIYSECTKLN